MSYDVIPTHQFEKELKRLVKKFPSLEKEFSEFIITISQRPHGYFNIPVYLIIAFACFAKFISK